ncbi:hypothetical protein TrRE_jg9774 [Triparma retinervis]|uniref:TLC domain-containing protein n=1 Tax=Triparma retinervis TaxID=2557542 RepID=A0A9W7L441_9STRA|nr:hypothetical protein TrRE_jg9774 [Triparma retinervis]
MLHHTLASTVLYLSLRFQTLHYYSPFFAGVTELSTVPLVLIDLDKFLILTSPKARVAVEVSKPVFALSFIVIRVFMWNFKWTRMLIIDLKALIKGGKFGEYRRGWGGVLWAAGGVNVALGAMQLFWASKIIRNVAKAVRGEEL